MSLVMIVATFFVLAVALSASLPSRARKIEFLAGLVGALAFAFVIPSGGADSPAGLWGAVACSAVAAGIAIAAGYLRSRFVSGNAHG